MEKITIIGDIVQADRFLELGAKKIDALYSDSQVRLTQDDITQVDGLIDTMHTRLAEIKSVVGQFRRMI